MLHWKHGDPYGQRVVVAAGTLQLRDFGPGAGRISGATGTVVGHSDSHGLCFQVKHDLMQHHNSGLLVRGIGWYDPDELTSLETPDMGHPCPGTPPEKRTRWERLLDESVGTFKKEEP